MSSECTLVVFLNVKEDVLRIFWILLLTFRIANLKIHNLELVGGKFLCILSFFLRMSVSKRRRLQNLEKYDFCWQMMKMSSEYVVGIDFIIFFENECGLWDMMWQVSNFLINSGSKVKMMWMFIQDEFVLLNIKKRWLKFGNDENKNNWLS